MDVLSHASPEAGKKISGKNIDLALIFLPEIFLPG
jgi:hypothetical protein